jgi:Aminotransferase class I and II
VSLASWRSRNPPKRLTPKSPAFQEWPSWSALRKSSSWKRCWHRNGANRRHKRANAQIRTPDPLENFAPALAVKLRCDLLLWEPFPPLLTRADMLAERMKGFSGSQTSGMRNRARKLRAEGIHVVNFAAGELDQDTSPGIKAAAHKAVESGRTQYTDTLGIRELRERVAAKITQKTGAAYTAEEVGFTAGAKQALFNANFVLFQPGDEVIIPSPYWVTLPEQVRLAGATPVLLPTGRRAFQIDIDDLAQAITERTRGIILNTPFCTMTWSASSTNVTTSWCMRRLCITTS